MLTNNTQSRGNTDLLLSPRLEHLEKTNNLKPEKENLKNLEK